MGSETGKKFAGATELVLNREEEEEEVEIPNCLDSWGSTVDGNASATSRGKEAEESENRSMLSSAASWIDAVNWGLTMIGWNQCHIPVPLSHALNPAAKDVSVVAVQCWCSKRMNERKVVREKLCTARNALQNKPSDEEVCEGSMRVTSSYELGSNELDVEFQEPNEHSTSYINPMKIVWESNEFVDSAAADTMRYPGSKCVGSIAESPLLPKSIIQTKFQLDSWKNGLRPWTAFASIGVYSPQIFALMLEDDKEILPTLLWHLGHICSWQLFVLGDLQFWSCFCDFLKLESKTWMGTLRISPEEFDREVTHQLLRVTRCSHHRDRMESHTGSPQHKRKALTMLQWVTKISP
ncbi:hypothetical protein B0H14DRAFT_2659238 [Mycena olivaceomarginata]|nr:hypothetical protein B0H14DRAFT_2659238 [Mycena olivaceomarginata]